jgi:N6-adenosine-specific RNA methylase IME4
LQEKLLHIEQPKIADHNSNSDLMRLLYGLGTGKYRTILIDPPWRMQDFAYKKVNEGQKLDYNTMSLEEIKALPISTLAADECDLFCWTTQTFLPDTFDILKAWGFKYHITLTWNKGTGLTMFGFRRQTEFCLYAYKGKLGVERKGNAIPTKIEDIPDLFSERSKMHSRKPQILYKYIEAKCKSPRLEIFARSKRAGWDVWGNQVPKSI